MPKQNYFEQGQLTDLSYLVLLTLVQSQHGYAIMNEIATMTEGEGAIGPASLYTTLRKLTEAGFITLVGNENKKKTYFITERGLATLRIEIKKRKQLAEYGMAALERYQEPASHQSSIETPPQTAQGLNPPLLHSEV